MTAIDLVESSTRAMGAVISVTKVGEDLEVRTAYRCIHIDIQTAMKGAENEQ